jgi:hypothetical protein
LSWFEIAAPLTEDITSRHGWKCQACNSRLAADGLGRV